MSNIPKLIQRIESWFNQVLALDEESLSKINELSSKTILLELKNSDLQFFLTAHKQGFKISNEAQVKPDVTIRSSASDFMLLFFNKFSNQSPPINMEVIGDIALGQQFQNIMLNIQIDWEEPLSRLIGDTATHKLASLMRSGKNYSAERLDAFVMNLSEYLRFESNQLPDKSEIEEFIQEVDLFRNDIDRIEQRIEKISHRIQTIGSP